MTIKGDIQKLAPGSLVSGITLDATSIGAGILRFHGHTLAGSIFWQGQEYSPWPMEAAGFAWTSERPPTPRVKLGNIDRSISTLCNMFDDFIGAKVTRWQTLTKFLDAANFGGTNPTADPNEHLPDEIWYVERKTEETQEFVEFELATAFDLNGKKLPARQVIADFCPWIVIGGYRGPYCGYTGPAVADVNDNPTTDINLDMCSGCLSGCKKRFGVNGPFPFGGAPGAGLIRI